jgi:hypothetical protein
MAPLIFLLGTAVIAQPARVAIDAALSPPQIRGSMRTTVTNTSTVALHELVLMLFPNRFAEPDPRVNDVNRPYVYPTEDFDAGGMQVAEVRLDGTAASTGPFTAPGLPSTWALRVALLDPLPPGASVSLEADFTTRVPERFGGFGTFDGMLTALGGWYPYLPPLRADGSWEVEALPPPADFDVRLATDHPLEVLVNGRFLASDGSAPVEVSVDGARYLTLAAAPVFLRETIHTDAGRILYFRRPAVRQDRIAPGPTQVEIMRASLTAILQRRPAAVPPPGGDLVVVEAPLRHDLTAPGEGMVVISDRSLKTLWLIRPFHDRQLARATYAELLRPTVSPRESGADYAWVSEGLSNHLAEAYYEKTYADVLSVQGWIDLFNVFAIVDRFETVPKIPFASAFFEQQPEANPMRDTISTYTRDLPPGHVILGKLEQQLGKSEYERLVSDCMLAAEPFRRCAGRGQDVDWLFAQWLQPYPTLSYAVEDFATESTEATETATVTVRRQSSRPIREPVDLRFRNLWGDQVDVRWEGDTDSGEVTARSPSRMHQVLLDPERKLIETTRVDNAIPPEFQFILDTAEVEVSSTEFGFSALAVGRARYDYHKDIAVAGVWSNRGIGAAVGPRLHWGEQIDPAAYRNNFYAFYTVQALDSDFRDDRQPNVRTAGHTNGIGVRYDYDNILWYDNPSNEVQLQLYADWYDESLGSDYDYVDWGASLVLTHPLWSYRSILAGQIVNGFSEPLGSSLVPNQGLYSLGGSRSIRGIGAEEELARNLFLVRLELRQTLAPELDLNFLDLLVLRRLQLRPFVDTGQVSNSAGAIYDPSGYSVGFGLGFGILYDVMGFFPSVAYLEVATSADDPGDVQVLFGTRQSF